MKVLDLFSGIGGFSLGLEAAGMETVAFCEIDPFCRRVLAKHWPDKPIYEDVKVLDGKQFRGTVDVVCGGYPCQGESVAGKRLGKKDIRWLGDQAIRIVEDCAPEWVIFENVAGHISSAFDGICARLEHLKFTVWPVDIYSCAAGLPTLERHIWIIAKANGKRQQGSGKKTIQDKPRFSQAFPRGDKGDYSRWNLPEARLCGMGERVPDRVDRLKSLGNAVPPEIPFIIGQAIMQYDQERLA